MLAYQGERRRVDVRCRGSILGVQSAERVDETEDGRVGCERWRDARREMRARTPTGPKRLWPGLDAGFLTSGAPRVLGGAAGNLRSEEAPRSPNAAGRADPRTREPRDRMVSVVSR